MLYDVGHFEGQKHFIFKYYYNLCIINVAFKLSQRSDRVESYPFLAHLSQRLTGELIVYP